jgi:hypothetical protein
MRIQNQLVGDFYRLKEDFQKKLAAYNSFNQNARWAVMEAEKMTEAQPLRFDMKVTAFCIPFTDKT